MCMCFWWVGRNISGWNHCHCKWQSGVSMGWQKRRSGSWNWDQNRKMTHEEFHKQPCFILFILFHFYFILFPPSTQLNETNGGTQEQKIITDSHSNIFSASTQNPIYTIIIYVIDTYIYINIKKKPNVTSLPGHIYHSHVRFPSESKPKTDKKPHTHTSPDETHTMSTYYSLSQKEFLIMQLSLSVAPNIPVLWAEFRVWYDSMRSPLAITSQLS